MVWHPTSDLLREFHLVGCPSGRLSRSACCSPPGALLTNCPCAISAAPALLPLLLQLRTPEKESLGLEFLSRPCCLTLAKST